MAIETQKVLYIVRAGEAYSITGHLKTSGKECVQKTAKLLAGELDRDELCLRFDHSNLINSEAEIPQIWLFYGPGKPVQQTVGLVVAELKPRPLHEKKLLLLNDLAIDLLVRGIPKLGIIVGTDDQLADYVHSVGKNIPPQGNYLRLVLSQSRFAVNSEKQTGLEKVF